MPAQAFDVLPGGLRSWRRSISSTLRWSSPGWRGDREYVIHGQPPDDHLGGLLNHSRSWLTAEPLEGDLADLIDLLVEARGRGAKRDQGCSTQFARVGCSQPRQRVLGRDGYCSS